jgi:hypothetical protein
MFMAKIRPQAQSVYGYETPVVTVFPSPVAAFRIPATSDTGYLVGQLWINQTTNQCWIMTSVAGGLATWALASPGASDVDTLTGDGGGAISPVAGDIILAGGTNVTSAGAGNTITFNLDPAVTLATSITSPLYTSAAADVLIVPGGANDVVLRLGDAAGATFLRVQSSAAADVFTIDSLGALGAMAGLTVTGAFTQTAGAVNIGQDNAANAVNIGGGTTARAIGIGNTAAAHILTLGSITGAASTILQSGTGDTLITSTDRITADSVGVLELNSSAAAIGIGNDADAFAINVGTGAAARTITLGNSTGATSLVLDCGTGALNIGANAIAHTITLGNSTGATSVVLDCGTGALNVGTNAIAHTVTIGNITGATAVNLNAGTGGTVITTTNSTLALASGTGAINVGVDAVAHTVTIGNAIGASSVVVNGGTGAMSFGANAIAHTTTIGNQVGASSTIIDAGTGDLLLTSTDAIVSGATGDMTFDSVGIMQMNSSGAAISIGNDADAFAINLGTGAAARTITIGNGTGVTSVVINNGTGALNIGTNATVHTTTVGSTTGASATVIQSGTGKITLTGTVVEMVADFIDVSGSQITFTQSPILQSNLTTGGVPTGVAGDVNIVSLQNGMLMEEFIIGTQTIIAPRMSANGLLTSLDLTNADGVEFNFGAARANSKHSFTIGTSPAFYLQWRFRVADVSGLEPCYIGFRKTQANDAVIANYTDFVAYGPNDAISPGDCAISTQLNTGGLTNTDTNDAFADGSTHTLRINVSAAGVVDFLFDNAAPTVTQAFTFDNGDVVHPFWRHTFNAAAPGTIDWISMECGNQ